MLFSLSLIFLVGLSASSICKKIRLPGLVGMLVTGIILGPFILDLIDPSVLNISAELRKAALIIILIRAGLSLNLSDLKKVGRPAILMSFVPATFEIIGYIVFAPVFLGLSHIEAAVLGAVLAAVSPAVVVPRMIKLTEENRGTGRGIPQLITAGASCDDIFVIVLFSVFVGMAQGGKPQVSDFLKIPVSVCLGISVGAAVGFLLFYFFETAHKKGGTIRNSVKVIIILAVSFLFAAAETLLENNIPFSGLLAVMGTACVLGMKFSKNVTARLSEKFGKIWIAAEILLFVLVGAAVDIRYTLEAGLPAIALIFTALIFRAAGVFVCLIKTPLTFKERIFCVIAYLPKATVQASIGSVPLSMGLACGNTVLSVAVLSILITAPLGAFGIDMSSKRLLNKE